MSKLTQISTNNNMLQIYLKE